MSAILSLPLLLALAQSCAPHVAPETLLSLVRVESAFDPLTIGVNARPHRSLHPAGVGQAVAYAQQLAARGVDFDVGLAQINARNLARLGLSLADAFDPCRNLAAGAQVLTGDYAASRPDIGEQAALLATLSRYNTGDPERGVRNGYVAKIYRAATQVIPAVQSIRSSSNDALTSAPVRLQPTPAPAPAAPLTPNPSARASLDVFARPSPAALVWSAGVQASGAAAPPPPQPGDAP